MEKLLTTSEAAALLGIKVSRVHQLRRAGILPHADRPDEGRAYRFRRSAVEAAMSRPKKPGWTLGKRRKSA